MYKLSERELRLDPNIVNLIWITHYKIAINFKRPKLQYTKKQYIPSDPN